jgi:two-component system invasion response regulator UvrY
MKILLIDDHHVVRDGLKRIFSEQLGPVLFGEASTVIEALNLAQAGEWDAVVLDLSLGDRSGLDILRELKQSHPRLPVLILTMHSEEQYARRAFKGGANGYITKDSPRVELIRALNTILQGGRYVSPALAERLAMNLDLGRDRDRPAQELLSDREFEVMRLIASGKTNRQIAGLLCLSDKTISTYRARILEKMGMKTNAELTHYVIKNGLLDNT